MTKWVSFDIEIARSIPDDVKDWSLLHPMGITCVSCWASDESNPRVWCGQNNQGQISDYMSAGELSNVVNYLHNVSNDGYRIVGLNTAGFDFQELAASSLLHDACKELSWNHYDLFFSLFCKLGYAPGLNAISVGMGFPGKTEGVNGSRAPELWQNGQYGKVLEYVANDARLTLDVALSVEQCREVRWTSKSGRLQVVKVDRWLTVREAALLPLPDVSWMKGKEWKREKFTGWMSN